MREHQQERACQVCRRPVDADGAHAAPPPWSHPVRPACSSVIGWTTRGLAVFATIPQVAEHGAGGSDPASAVDDETDIDEDGQDGDAYDTVLGRWWDVARYPVPPQD